ncbi:MAG: VWA domain-containing protein, partial [Chloroflexi bacterium]|nr:VWA domain-containing protein [Chloroflexota bacterium]
MRLSFEQPLWLLLVLLVPLVLRLALPRLRAMARWRRRGALILRAAVLSLTIMALADPVSWRPDDKLSVAFVVDQSDSMAGQQRAAAEAWLGQALGSAGPADRVAVVRFGRHAVADVEGVRAAAASPSGPNAAPPSAGVDGTATNLEEALRLAGDLLSPTGGRRLVLLTDGWENVGSAQDAATQALPPGTQVSHALPGYEAAGPEVALRALEAPSFVRDGSTFEAAAVVDSIVETDATLRLFLDGRPVAEQPVHLQVGPNRFSLAQRARSLGFRRLRVEVVARDDTRTDNNAAEASTVVKAAGSVLLLEGHGGEASRLAESLREGGLQVEVRPPTDVPPRTEPLERFDAVGMVNVAATQLTLDQQRTLQQYVQNLGRGLIVAGGSTSFALGGYAGTVLDEILPVSPAPPTRREQGSVALYLVIDKSGSMDLYRSDVSKMAMAREAAILSIEALRADDTLGVLAFDSRHAWAVPPTKIKGPGEIRAAQANIAAIKADGGTSIFPALEEAYKAAAQSDAKLKHIILLTDGQSFDADYAGLVNRMRPNQITLSTIAVGSDSDTKLLTMLAQIGTGRYYFTERAQDVPKITTKETTIVTRGSLVEGRVLPQLVEASPIMLGLTGGELPPLGGYVAATSRPRATNALSSDRGDPLLAHWQYGLGRVVAWTSDAGGEWTGDWSAWPEGDRFWQQAIRWTMPEPTASGFQVAAVVTGDQVALRAQSVRPDGRFADLQDTRVTVIAPDGRGREIGLPQTAPGVYGLTTTAAASGAYEARFAQYERGQVVREETLGFTVPAAAELRAVGVNRPLLNRLAARGGGRELIDPADAFARDFPPNGERSSPLWP